MVFKGKFRGNIKGILQNPDLMLPLSLFQHRTTLHQLSKLGNHCYSIFSYLDTFGANNISRSHITMSVLTPNVSSLFTQQAFICVTFLPHTSYHGP